MTPEPVPSSCWIADSHLVTELYRQSPMNGAVSMTLQLSVCGITHLTQTCRYVVQMPLLIYFVFEVHRSIRCLPSTLCVKMTVEWNHHSVCETHTIFMSVLVSVSGPGRKPKQKHLAVFSDCNPQSLIRGIHLCMHKIIYIYRNLMNKIQGDICRTLFNRPVLQLPSKIMHTSQNASWKKK